MAAYAHGVLVESPARWVHTCGVVAKAGDGTIPETVDGHLDVIWDNIRVILAEAGMGISDIVSMTTWLVENSREAARHGPVDERLALVEYLKALAEMPPDPLPAVPFDWEKYPDQLGWRWPAKR